jgi:hypothetical protein
MFTASSQYIWLFQDYKILQSHPQTQRPELLLPPPLQKHHVITGTLHIATNSSPIIQPAPASFKITLTTSLLLLLLICFNARALPGARHQYRTITPAAPHQQQQNQQQQGLQRRPAAH